MLDQLYHELLTKTKEKQKTNAFKKLLTHSYSTAQILLKYR